MKFPQVANVDEFAALYDLQRVSKPGYIAGNAATPIPRLGIIKSATGWKSEVEYERFIFRGLRCYFEQGRMLDATQLPLGHPIYAPGGYSASPQLGQAGGTC